MRIKQDMADLQRDYGLQCRNAIGLGHLFSVASAFHPTFSNFYVIASLASTLSSFVSNVLSKKT